jgi:hypothetical protein
MPFAGRTNASPATGAADVRAVLDVQRGREPRVVVNRDVFETAVWRNRLFEFRKRFAA